MMRSRADAVEGNRQRIVRAMFDLAESKGIPETSLGDVAAAAGVSVQTILRQYGSREGLIEAAIQYGSQRVVQERAAPVGDVGAAVRVVVDHYEERGRSTLRMLTQESTYPQVAAVTQVGRDVHRKWVADVFEPYIGADERLIDLLVVATDVYTWKLLRLDRGLPRTETEERMRALVSAVLSSADGEGGR
ncbi:TetR/AcrR family transcriptional regulator [Sinomonas gamaensis]|uniref:TetR/AcrR family transcriptional regulator n=1 Tax=Sinomonas gamaensis TaxID=2565624 RepID=UPI001486DD2E|nr:TetR/AcrR family transcriptional regulator [Sinomonas gamaensis]